MQQNDTISSNSRIILCNQIVNEVSNDFITYDVVTDRRYFLGLTNEEVSKSSEYCRRLYTYKEIAKFVPIEIIDRCVFFRNIGRLGFSERLSEGVYHGCSAIYFSIQLAYSMGAKNIYIHGGRYDYGNFLKRPSSENALALPDIVMSSTIMAIRDYAFPILHKNGVNLYLYKDAKLR